MSERSIEDAAGEAMRRERHGQVRPLWAELSDDLKAPWIKRAEVLLSIMGSIGLETDWSPTI